MINKQIFRIGTKNYEATLKLVNGGFKVQYNKINGVGTQ